jgi:hypothetical protein
LKKYLVWLDILGFYRRAEEIAEFAHQSNSGKIRAELVNILRERIEITESKGNITGKAYENDQWILMAETLDSVLEVVSCILDHDTGYTSYEKIPLEIGIGAAEYPQQIEFKGAMLLFQRPTVEFLKTRLIDHYHEWYKQTHSSESPRKTFMVLTESAYQDLEAFDRNQCSRVEVVQHKDRKKEVTAFFTIDPGYVEQRGRVFRFLEKIGVPKSKLYDRIDSLFIPPIEFEEIKDALMKNRVVFISGTAEYGKTYAAVRLMWEYYLNGYAPVWLKGEERWERQKARKRLEEIETELKPHYVLYFEDPFGKTQYEKREFLEREIGTIVECIRSVNDVYVIVTSREEVFKRFKKEQLSSLEVQKFEKRLNLKRPSYNLKRRQQILLKWAESKDCRWFKVDELTKLVLENMQECLYTPLSIRDFVLSTVLTTDEYELIGKIGLRSEETSRRFAREIESARDDKQLFLSFLFIFDFPVSFVEAEYNGLVKRLNVKKLDTFGEVFDWFKDDKITVSDGQLTFSHRSYFESLTYLLTKDGHPTRFNTDIVCKVLLTLSEKHEAAFAVSDFVNLHFGAIPSHVRDDLLLRLSGNEEAASIVAEAVASNFRIIPSHVRDDLLLRLSRHKGEAARTVTRIILSRFDYVSKKTRELLDKLCKEDTFHSEATLLAIAENYERVQEDMRNLFFRIAERDRSADYFARIVDMLLFFLDEHTRKKLHELLTTPC